MQFLIGEVVALFLPSWYFPLCCGDFVHPVFKSLSEGISYICSCSYKSACSGSDISFDLQPLDVVNQESIRLLCPWGSPGKSAGAGCHFLLQGNLPNSGIEPMSPALADVIFTTVPYIKDMYTRTHTLTLTHSHSHQHMHTHARTHTNTCILTHSHSPTPTHAHTHTCSHSHTHSHTNTHTHTQTVQRTHTTQ